jgi:hypothetical protein
VKHDAQKKPSLRSRSGPVAAVNLSLALLYDRYGRLLPNGVAGGYGAMWIVNHLRRRTRTNKSAGLSFWNTSAYTLKKALDDPDNLAANLIDYVNGFSTEIDVFKNFGFEAQIKELDEHNRLGLVTEPGCEFDIGCVYEPQVRTA